MNSFKLVLFVCISLATLSSAYSQLEECYNGFHGSDNLDKREIVICTGQCFKVGYNVDQTPTEVLGCKDDSEICDETQLCSRIVEVYDDRNINCQATCCSTNRCNRSDYPPPEDQASGHETKNDRNAKLSKEQREKDKEMYNKMGKLLKMLNSAPKTDVTKSNTGKKSARRSPKKNKD